MPARKSGFSREPFWRAHELGTPWWSDPEAPPAGELDPAAEARSGPPGEPDSPAQPAAGQGWWWAAALVAGVGTALLAAVARSSLLLPAIPIATLVVLSGLVVLALRASGLAGRDSDIPAVVPGVAAMMLGWALGGWMLSLLPALLSRGSSPVPVRALLAVAAVLAACALPGLAIALGRRGRAQHADASFAVRLGVCAAVIQVVAAVALALLAG